MRVVKNIVYGLLYGMPMSVSSLVHWPLMGGLLHLALVGSFGIHADCVYLRGLTLCTQHSERLVIFIYTKTNLLVW